MLISLEKGLIQKTRVLRNIPWISGFSRSSHRKKSKVLNTPKCIPEKWNGVKFCGVAKVVYENKDWNITNTPSALGFSFRLHRSLRKQGLKHYCRCQTTAHFLKCCKSGLRKQGLKLYLHGFPCALSTLLQKGLRKQGLKHNKLWIYQLVYTPWLQKWSKKTRIETLDCFLYRNGILASCKSGLRKQGLKQFCCSCTVYQWIKLQKGLRKQGLKQSETPFGVSDTFPAYKIMSRLSPG